MIRRLAIFLVCLVLAYVVTAVAQAADVDPLPRSADWWDLLYGIVGAVVGWLTRFLQGRISQR